MYIFIKWLSSYHLANSSPNAHQPRREPSTWGRGWRPLEGLRAVMKETEVGATEGDLWQQCLMEGLWTPAGRREDLSQQPGSAREAATRRGLQPAQGGNVTFVLCLSSLCLKTPGGLGVEEKWRLIKGRPHPRHGPHHTPGKP